MIDRWEMPRSCVSAAMLTELATEHGLAAAHVLRGTGITPQLLNDPTAEITAGQELTLVRNLINDLATVDGLGIAAGKRYHAPSFGPLGFAMISSPTVREALEVVTRWFELSFSFSTLRRHDDDATITLVLDDTGVPGDIKCFNTERDLSAICTMIRSLLPAMPILLAGLDIALPEPRYVAKYADIAAAVATELRFGSAATALHIDAALLPLPLPQANRHIAEMCVQQCATLLQRRRARAGVSGHVRDHLLRRGHAADQDEVARELSMSVRTLRRRLTEEGTSYRELVAETLGMLAEELLRTGMPVEQIAERLGYADASSFTHAFKSWKGMTPGRYARERVGNRTSQPIRAAY